MNRLERLSHPQCIYAMHTTKVTVYGTWYMEYDEVDSKVGRDDLLSPAVRMLNMLLAIVLAKMPNLMTFM